MSELLALREDARRRFAGYLKRYRGKLDDGLWRRLAAYAPADALETDDKRETVVVEKTGAAVQCAIDRMHSSGGGRVVLRGGVYESGTIYLKSGVELRIEKDAVLRGPATPDGYDDVDDPRIGKAPERSRKAFIVCLDGRDVAITGEGTIDGQGVSFYDTKVPPGARHFAKPALPRPRMVQFFKCDGVRFEGVTFKDSPGWTFWLRMCDDVTVNGIVVDGDMRMINNDGLHFDGCRRVRVRDSRLSTGDDCIVVRANRSHNGDSSLCEDVEVSRCVLRSACQAVRIGCPSDGNIRRVSFTDVDISGYNGVASVHPLRYLQRGSRGGCNIDGILFERCRIDVEAAPVVIDVQPGVVLGGICNFVFRDSKMRGGSEMIVRGTAESPVGGVRFENVEVANSPSTPSGFNWKWESDSWEVEP